MDEDDFNNLISNSSDVKNIIQEAIKNLDKVNITEEDKEELAENAAISLNKIYGDFVVKWKKMDNILTLLNNENENLHYNSQKLKDNSFRTLVKNKLLNIRDYETYLNLRHIRNKIVHEANFELDEFYLNQALKDLEIITDKLVNLTYFMNNSNGYYEISKKNESYSFVLRNSYGWILLYGIPSLNKDEILKSIAELKEIAKDINNYEKIKGEDEVYYFNLKGKNTLILATSEFYTSNDIVDSKIMESITFSQTNQIIDKSDDGDETYCLAF
ncbi:YegP family protein [Acinetobacter pittii]